MLGLYLVPLLAASIFVVTLDGEDEDDELHDEVDAAVEPNADDLVHGTYQDDLLQADGADTIYGGEGDDTLIASDTAENAVLNGEDGDDMLDISANIGIANGGDGDDVLVLNGSNDPETPATAVVNGDAGDDTITSWGIGGTLNGGIGSDSLTANGAQRGVFGGEGQDTLIADGGESGLTSPLDGGVGDDVLIIENSAEIQSGTTALGDRGEDVFQTTTYIDDDGSTDFHILTGGEGDDRFELHFVAEGLGNGGYDAGIVQQITDFSIEDDVLAIDANMLAAANTPGSLGATVEGFELIEAEDGSYTDVVFSALAENGVTTMTGTIRLLGVTGMDESAILLFDTSED